MIVEIKKATLYSDGACSGNPGPGGYGAILIYEDNIDHKPFSKGYKHTTNNRMELLGIIEPLETLEERHEIIVITDSQYVVNAINKKWLHSWIVQSWKTAGKKLVKNQDLWTRMLDVLNNHRITMQWVRGHSGHSENERCDELAVKARKGKNLYIDKGYEDIIAVVQNKSRTTTGVPPCVRCGYCCNKVICGYGEHDKNGKCWFLMEDDPRFGTYRCTIKNKIMEKEEGSSTPMFDNYCSSSAMNTIREKVIRLTNEI